MQRAAGSGLEPQQQGQEGDRHLVAGRELGAWAEGKYLKLRGRAEFSGQINYLWLTLPNNSLDGQEKEIKGRGFSNPCRIQAASQKDHPGTAAGEQAEVGRAGRGQRHKSHGRTRFQEDRTVFQVLVSA